ncbi:RNA polymerase sigma-F factor [Geobacillus sp. BCO2]|nr:RNA polymerase sigma-F factor [Geobacillus sp. BCO2]
MDVDVKQDQSPIKDQEMKELIRRSQEGDQEARDEIIEKTCASSGRSFNVF